MMSADQDAKDRATRPFGLEADEQNHAIRLIRGAEFQEITTKSISLEQHNVDVQRCLEDFLYRRFLRD